MSDDDDIIIIEDEEIPEENPENILTLEEILQYADVKDELDAAKKVELAFRNSICEKIKRITINNETAKSTDKKFKLETEEFLAEFKPGINRNYDEDMLEEEWQNMTDAEKECFWRVWKFGETKFKKLQELVDSKDYEGEKDLVIFQIVSEKSGASSLSITLK